MIYTKQEKEYIEHQDNVERTEVVQAVQEKTYTQEEVLAMMKAIQEGDK